MSYSEREEQIFDEEYGSHAAMIADREDAREAYYEGLQEDRAIEEMEESKQ